MLLQSLYSRGARKFGVAGLPPIGCVPLVMSAGSIGPSTHVLRRLCLDELNQYSQDYNTKLQDHLTSFQQSLPDSKIAYFGIYDPIMDMINNPLKYGTLIIRKFNG